MILSEALIIGLLIVPPAPTQSFDYSALSRMVIGEFKPAPLTQNPVYSKESKGGTVPNEIEIGTIKSVVLENFQQARVRALEKLKDRISFFKYDLAETSDDLTEFEIDKIITASHKILDTIPTSVNLPNAMILSRGISMYWNFGDIYAELAIEGSDSVSIYAKHPTLSEVLIDSNIDEIVDQNYTFPIELEEILT